jgi:hypothetical protein
MKLIEVTDQRTVKEFLQVNVLMNQGNPEYIRPLDKDIEQVFDPGKNKAFRHGKAIRWILKDDSGQLIGRIAAFMNKKYRTVGDKFPVGGIGFFDCINDQSAANFLFDTAKNWLKEQGAEAMDGPINFGERDKWWGLLVKGFQSPLYCMNYNPPYYQELFESYGFKNFFNQYCFALKVRDRVQDKFYKRHAMIAKDPSFRAEHLTKDKLDKYANDFATVYNKAWAGHGGMKEIKKDAVLTLFKQMKPVMDEKIIWFVYHNNEPIALWANIPDLNFWFRHLNGQFGPLAKLKFLWIKMTRPCKRFTGLVFGIVPEFQGKGIDSFMIMEGAKIIQHKLHYEDYELQWIGDWNPKMINVAESLGTYRSRELITYRYIFDRNLEFKRHPVL